MTPGTTTNVSVDIGNNLTSLIERLAQQIGVAADKIFPWYVQQQVLEGGVFFIIMLLTLVLLAGVFIFSITKADFDRENVFCGLAVGSGVLLFAMFMIFMIGAGMAATQILNPEYHAMKAIAADLGKLRGGN